MKDNINEKFSERINQLLHLAKNKNDIPQILNIINEIPRYSLIPNGIILKHLNDIANDSYFNDGEMDYSTYESIVSIAQSELDEIVKTLMKEVNNEDINFVEKPVDRLKEEQKYLSSMPSIDCISQYFHQNKGYKVSKESKITYKKHKYSVPIKYIGEYLTVKENEDILNIYYTTDLVVSHKISGKYLNYKKEHVHEILRSDAMKNGSDEKIDKYIEENLSKMDIFLE